MTALQVPGPEPSKAYLPGTGETMMSAVSRNGSRTSVEMDTNGTQDPRKLSFESFGSPKDVALRTLVFRIQNKKRPFFRADFHRHLSRLIKDEEVVGFGSLGRNDLWNLVVSNREARIRVMKAGDFLVDNTLVKVSSLGREEFPARIHMCPLHLPMEMITDELGRYAEVLSAQFERSPKSHWGHAATMVRTVMLKGDMHEVPHRMTVGTGWSRTELLVTITGRPPLCFKCNQVGHVRSNCEVPVCRHCRQVGHHTEDCVNPKRAAAYASMVKGPEVDLSRMDDVDQGVVTSNDQQDNTEDNQSQSQSLLAGGPPHVAPKDSAGGEQPNSDMSGVVTPVIKDAIGDASGVVTGSGGALGDSYEIPNAQKSPEVAASQFSVEEEEEWIVPGTQKPFSTVSYKRKNSPSRVPLRGKSPKVGDIGEAKHLETGSRFQPLQERQGDEFDSDSDSPPNIDPELAEELMKKLAVQHEKDMADESEKELAEGDDGWT